MGMGGRESPNNAYDPLKVATERNVTLAWQPLCLPPQPLTDAISVLINVVSNLIMSAYHDLPPWEQQPGPELLEHC